MAFAMDLGGFAGTAAKIIQISLGVLFGAALMGGGAWFYLKKKKYGEYDCVIWNKNTHEESTDRGGIFVDKKTQNKRFYLEKSNVGLSPDNIPFKRRGMKKIVYLVQSGLKNFSYIDVKVSNPTVTLSVTEEDVNWAINAYDRQKKLFVNSMLMQMLPYISLVFVSMVILILFFYLFKKFDVLASVAGSLSQAAETLANAKAGVIG